MYKCKYCSKSFTLDYRRVGEPSFCSKSCKSSAQMGKYRTKAKLEQDIRQVIKNNARYTTKEEILQKLKISSKTLTKFSVSILSLNKASGYVKPKSVFEFNVYVKLEKILEGFDIVCEWSPQDLKSPKGFPLRIDFYVPRLNLAIEADGTQHFDSKNPNWDSYGVLCDETKNSYCAEHGITLLRIPYKRHVTEDYVRNCLTSVTSL